MKMIYRLIYLIVLCGKSLKSDISLQSSVSERITPSADSKFDPSFQVFFCDDVEELNEAYFRDFTVNDFFCYTG